MSQILSWSSKIWFKFFQELGTWTIMSIVWFKQFNTDEGFYIFKNKFDRTIKNTYFVNISVLTSTSWQHPWSPHTVAWCPWWFAAHSARLLSLPSDKTLWHSGVAVLVSPGPSASPAALLPVVRSQSRKLCNLQTM